MNKGYDFAYVENGIHFKAFYQNNRYKVRAKLGNKTVIEFGKTLDEAAEKAKKILKAPLE